MTTDIHFTISKHHSMDTLYISIQDHGFTIKSSKDIDTNKLNVMIPINETERIVSNGPMISLKTDDLQQHQKLKEILVSIYSKYGLYHSYNIDNFHYQFIIYHEALQFIIDGIYKHPELKDMFLSCNIYLCVSSRFKGISVSNYLTDINKQEYYKQYNIN